MTGFYNLHLKLFVYFKDQTVSYQNTPLRPNCCIVWKAIKWNIKEILPRINFCSLSSLTLLMRQFVDNEGKGVHIKWLEMFGKFGLLCLLVTPVLRFALLPYYRRIHTYPTMSPYIQEKHCCRCKDLVVLHFLDLKKVHFFPCPQLNLWNL